MKEDKDFELGLVLMVELHGEELLLKHLVNGLNERVIGVEEHL